MRGYDFSVWLLPRNRSKILQCLKSQGIIVTHIPHITIKTNFETKGLAFDFAETLTSTVNITETKYNPTHKSYKYSLFGSLSWMDRASVDDPLTAWVLPAKIPELEIPNPHLSVKYMKHETFPKSAKINISGEGDVVVADTQNDDPRKWHLCYTRD
jgi:hypothetical protein